MTDRDVHPDKTIAAEPAVTRAELTMARRVDSRFEQAARNSLFATSIVVYAILSIVGIWLRTLLIPQGWQVVAACAFVASLAGAIPWLSWVSGRKPPGWVASAESCQEALKDLIPVSTMAVVSQAIDRVRQHSGRRRWHGVYVYLSRCARSGPPDNGMCQNAGVTPMSGRLIVVMGEHMTDVSPQITAAVLAHESRHVRPVRMYLSCLVMLSRLAGWVIVGWAVSWPSLLPALLAFHIAATLLSWVVEASCDLGGAAEVGPGAMLAALDHLSNITAQISKDRSRSARRARAALIWAAGPTHPPLALRRALVGLPRPRSTVRNDEETPLSQLAGP